MADFFLSEKFASVIDIQCVSRLKEERASNDLKTRYQTARTIKGTKKQGCGVGVESGVRVGWSRPFWLESESELELVKFGLLRLRPGVAGQHPAADDDYGRTVMHPPENIERREEKENSSG